MKKGLLLNAALIFSFSFCSFAIAEIDFQTYSKKGFDECFDKTLSGERVVVPCEIPSQIMSASAIQQSLEQFREFEESDIVEEVFEAARVRDAQPQSKTSPYNRSITEKELHNRKNLTYEEFKKQEIEKSKEHQSYIEEWLERDRNSRLRPEIKSKAGSVRNGLYRVVLVFVNNADFPSKYSRHSVFRENTTAQFAADWEEIIFKHYLEDDYKHYKPKLGAVHDLVVITIHVDGSETLGRLIEGKPVKSISHIGKTIEEQGAVLP